MLTTTTPCRITKENNKFMASFDEFPEFEPLLFDDIEYLLEIASVYLALCMITNDREFEPHTKPLTPPDNLGPKDIFSLIVVDINQVLDILNSENVAPSQMLEWILNDSEGEKKPKTESTSELEPLELNQQAPQPDKDEFDVAFVSQEETPPVSPSLNKEEPSSLHDKIETVNKERDIAKDVFVAAEEDEDGINFVSKYNRKEPEKKPDNKPKRQPPKNNKYKNKNKYNKYGQNNRPNNNKNPAN